VLKAREEWTRKGKEGERPGPLEIDTQSEDYQRKLNRLIDHELIMLQTFGFDISIDHPHKHVIRATQFMRAPRELSQVAYFMATNSLYLTTFCIEMRSEIVAATCIYLAFKWSEYEVGLSTDGREWWSYLDQTLKEDQLVENVKTYVKILQDHPTKMHDMKKSCQNSRPIKSSRQIGASSSSSSSSSSANQKRPKPDDSAAQDPSHKRLKHDDKPRMDLPPVRPPGMSSKNHPPTHAHKESRKSAPGGMPILGHSEPRSNKPSGGRGDGRATNLPRLKSDLDYVKKCLRDTHLWNQLSDEEKEYCKLVKAKLKRKRDEEKQRRQRDQNTRGPPPASETQDAIAEILM